MFKIRKEQIDAFLPQDDSSRIDFILEHLEDEHNEYISDMPTRVLRDMIANGLKRARQYGFNELEDMTVFVTWMFIIAPNFDEQSELKHLLHEKTLSAGERIDKMLADGLDSSWDEAQDNYNSDAWFPELQNEDEEE